MSNQFCRNLIGRAQELSHVVVHRPPIYIVEGGKTPMLGSERAGSGGPATATQKGCCRGDGGWVALV